MLDGNPLSIDAVYAVARSGAQVELSSESRKRITEARSGMLERAATGDPLYGINTGFGSFSHVR